jgi:hypothetical protein
MLKLDEKSRDEVVLFLGQLLLPTGIGTGRDSVINFLKNLPAIEDEAPDVEKSS